MKLLFAAVAAVAASLTTVSASSFRSPELVSVHSYKPDVHMICSYIMMNHDATLSYHIIDYLSIITTGRRKDHLT